MRHRMDFPLPPLFWLTIWLTFLVVFASIAGERRDMQQKKKPLHSIEYQGFRLVGMTGLATAQSATAPLNAFPLPLAAEALKTNLRKKIASQPTFVFHAIVCK